MAKTNNVTSKEKEVDLQKLEDQLQNLSAEIESISGNCTLLAAGIEYNTISNTVLFNTICAISHHLQRVSDDVERITFTY